MPTFVKIGSVADTPPGTVREVRAGGRTMALANIDGGFYAVDNECLHQGGPLAEGELSGEWIECPWHSWQYSMKTGECAHEPALKLARYEVKVEGDDILIAV
jgi:nitrite reductase/ring-hydroxylating ferredoxin subunit